MEALRRQGLFVTEIKEAPVGTIGYASVGGTKRRRIGRGRLLKNLAMFTRQLSVLMTSGTPLVQALGALERQSADNNWRQVIGALRVRVEEGATLSAAMDQHPDVFDPVCRSLISAGESGSSFDEMLDRLPHPTPRPHAARQPLHRPPLYP